MMLTEAELEFHPPIGAYLMGAALVWIHTADRYGIRVDLFDTQEVGSRGLSLIAYRLAFLHDGAESRPVQDQMGEARRHEPRWEIIFTGEDFEPGPFHGDEMMLADLLGFLAAYDELSEINPTPRQREWLTSHRDELSTWSAELEEEDAPNA